MTKKFWVTLTGIILLIFLSYTWMTWENNREESWPNEGEIKLAYDSAVEWLLGNRGRLLKQNNVFLWHMVKQSASLTDDSRLQELYEAYHKRHGDYLRHSYWRMLFNDRSWVPVRYEHIERLDDYQQLMVYALACDDDLAREPTISAQMDHRYCNAYPFRSSCITHQMMGLVLMKERGCGNSRQVDQAISALQQRIADQLTWDPRLVDQYIQRVLMLLVTDARGLLKPVWIRRIVAGSQKDGGWPSYRRLVNLPGNRDLLLTRNFLGLGKTRSTFHATAQALLIMSILLTDHSPE